VSWRYVELSQLPSSTIVQARGFRRGPHSQRVALWKLQRAAAHFCCCRYDSRSGRSAVRCCAVWMDCFRRREIVSVWVCCTCCFRASWRLFPENHSCRNRPYRVSPLPLRPAREHNRRVSRMRHANRRRKVLVRRGGMPRLAWARRAGEDRTISFVAGMHDVARSTRHRRGDATRP